jgi:assimilatory nitrate reductase catalytic subunit
MTAVRSTCPYCGVGCGLLIDSNAAGETRIQGDPEHPANYGRLCSKGAALGETLDHEDRLLEPLIEGEPKSWSEALDLVATKFRETAAKHGPDAIAFYVSGQLLTEDYYVANKLMKGFIGSGNIDTNSRLCMASAVAGYKRAFGADVVPASYADIEQAELLVIAGSNMAWCHPVLFQRAREAKEINPDMRVVVIDPRRTASCDIADLHLPIRPGTDVILFNGLLDYLYREDALDRGFIEANTEDFAAALRTARQTAGTVPDVASACDVREHDVADFFALFKRMPRTVTLFSQGINQSTSGTDKVNSIINVHLATGRIGKAGAGPFSLTGQPNAMGGREVGGLSNVLAAHMEFTPGAIERVSRFWGVDGIASRPGLKAIDLFEAVAAGEVRAIWIMSTNPVVSMPNADRVRAALERCEFVVVSDCVRDTDTTACAKVLLPATTWAEKSGTVTNSERRISRQRAFLEPAGQSRPDWWIICEVARRMGFEAAFDYDSPAAIFREHARLSAFENDGTRAFDIRRLATIDDREYDALSPVRWPARTSPADEGGPFSDARFFTPSRKARFVPTYPRATRELVSPRYPLLLVTGRVRDHWHTMTRTAKSPRLSQTQVEVAAQVHPADAAENALRDRCLARLTSPHGSLLARIDISNAVRHGEVFVPMHWSDQFSSQARVGALIAPHVDAISGQPELKATPVSLAAVQVDWYGFVLSRDRVAIDLGAYVSVSRGDAFWRYEMAGCGETDWPTVARSLLGGEGDWVELFDRKAGRYRGARLENNRLNGCIFTSASVSLPDRRWLGEMFRANAVNDAQRMSLLAGRSAEAGAASGATICACFSVGRDTLVEAIRTQRLTTAKAIGAALSAGTNCGSCVPELNALVAEYAQETKEAVCG